MQADLGYLGIEKLHANSEVPYFKESKNHKLTKREKAYNRRLARHRFCLAILLVFLVQAGLVY